MGKALKSLRKTAWGHKIVDLVAPLMAAPDAVGATVLALACPGGIEGTPPFAAAPAPRPADPRGGLAAPISLPLPVTPFIELTAKGAGI